MTYRVSYTGSFSRDLKGLAPQIARRIVKFLTERIDGSDDPRQFGQALRGAKLGELWRYRGGWATGASSSALKTTRSQSWHYMPETGATSTSNRTQSRNVATTG